MAIRVDASATIGTGHLKRCLSLVQALIEQGAQVSLVEPGLALLGVQGQPILYLGLLYRQLLLQHIEHGLVAVAVRVKAVAQAQCLSRIVQHAGVSQPTAVEHGK